MAIEKTPNVPPFVSYCAQLIPTVFDNSLSYYEALSALAKWMQDNLVDVINNNATVTEQYIRMTEELKAYVENYFDNLDVQEEINNKLDEMAENGTLEEIIADYIQAKVAWTFNNVNEMKASENFIDGSYARTLGFHEVNDGGASLYYIRKITNADVVDESSLIAITGSNDLVAELIIERVMTPEQFGAYGDETQNDTTALQICLDKSKNIVINKSFLINSQLTISNPVSISGCGSIKGNKIVVSAEGTSIKDITIKNSTADGIVIDSVSNVTISNVTMNTLNGCGVLVNTTEGDVENIIIDSCKIYKPSQGADANYSPIGIYFASGDVNQVKNSKIVNCYLEDCGYIGIFPNGFNNIVDGCTVNGSGKVKASAASGIWLHDASDITVTNSTFTKCNSYAIRASKARNITINNCIITENLQYGVGFVYDGNATGKYQGETANKNVLLTNCRIYDNSTSSNNTFYGIYVGGYNDVTISDCEVFSLNGHQGRPVYEASESSHASTNLKIVDCKFYGSSINTIQLANASALNRSTYRSGTKENDSWMIPVSGTSATITLPPNTDYVTVHTTQALPMDMGIGVTRYTEQVKAVGTSVYHGIYSIQITNAGVVTLSTLAGYAVNTSNGTISSYTPDTNNLRSIEVKVNN